MKKMKYFNLALIVIASICGVLYSVEAIREGQLYLVLIRLAIIPVMLIPFFLKRVLKWKISPIVETMYLIFVFCAHFLGSIVNFYNTIYCYDKIIHFISGALTAFLGFILLVKLDSYKSKNIWFHVLFIISFTMLVASMWEMFEYTCDNLFGKDAQHVLTTGVNDTMQDMIVAFLGSILVSIAYLYEKMCHVKLLITSFIKEIER